MGVWEWIYSATDAVKQKTPDLTPATEFGRKTYDYCRHTTSYAAAGGVAKARDLHQYLSDDQVRDNLGRFAKSASKNGALYLARSYGGGPIIDIVSRSVQEKKTDSEKDRIKELETKVAKLEKELICRKIAEQSELPKVVTTSNSQDEANVGAIMNQTPDDVLKIFMMKPFVGTKLFDNLMIPVGAESKRKENPV
ncbi:hypothetical protein BVRB_5g106740 [Beta vulgaris subsp. vulgaris]|nr:hypothetical protein BVRB_5g106740 [Beta vulgaris subsp. vulgaris]